MAAPRKSALGQGRRSLNTFDLNGDADNVQSKQEKSILLRKKPCTKSLFFRRPAKHQTATTPETSDSFDFVVLAF